MKETEDRFWRIFNCEKELDTVRISGLEIGGVCASINRDVFFDNFNRGKQIKFFVFLKYLFQHFTFPPQKNVLKNYILLLKTGEGNHYNKLIDPIFECFKEDSLIVLYGKILKSEKKITLKSDIFIIIYTLIVLIININRIKRIYNRYNFNVSKVNFIFQSFPLFHQAYLWKKIFNQSHIKIIVVDHDRQKHTSPIVKAAKSCNIKSIVLMHGVINPPYGYTPLIGDEIWVWGVLQREQLLSLGCKFSQIKIIGNPIAEKRISKTTKRVLNIGVAVNPIGDELNYRLWRNLIDFIKEKKPHFNIFVKLHPSMKKNEKNKNIFGSNCTLLSSNEIDNFDFFEQIDILLVGNSGIAYEAIINDVLVCVKKETINSTGNDSVMINLGKFPEVTTDKLFLDFIEDIEVNQTFFKHLLAEKNFVYEYIYSSYGAVASENIINEFKDSIRQVIPI